MAITAGPCTWPDSTSQCCADEWATYSSDLQAEALEFATYIIWTATGRQYGLCEITVRPCGRTQREGANSGYYWDGYGTWIPYIWNGAWYNACGIDGPGCTCDPRCQVYLPGPVDSIISVQVDGASLPVTGDDGLFNYFVLEQQWLVRAHRSTATDQQAESALCWPTCSNQSRPPGDPDAFEVTYRKGIAVPSVLGTAVARYACEYAKGCSGQACRLPSRVTSLSRQGVNVQLADINDVLKNGLTGLWEVDQLIMRFNPYGLQGKTRFYSPDLPEGRQVTWP